MTATYAPRTACTGPPRLQAGQTPSWFGPYPGGRAGVFAGFSNGGGPGTVHGTVTVGTATVEPVLDAVGGGRYYINTGFTAVATATGDVYRHVFGSLEATRQTGLTHTSNSLRHDLALGERGLRPRGNDLRRRSGGEHVRLPVRERGAAGGRRPLQDRRGMRILLRGRVHRRARHGRGLPRRPWRLRASRPGGRPAAPHAARLAAGLGRGRDRARLDPSLVYIVGGTGAVGPAVASDPVMTGRTVRRIAGSDRYATAVAVADEMESAVEEYLPDAFLVSGTGFADALAVAPSSAHAHIPILLTKPGVLPDVTRVAISRLGVQRVWIAGGTGAVGASVQATVEAMPSVSTSRAAGADRYSTAVAATEMALRQGWTGCGYTCFATGEKFPDALAAGAMCGHEGGSLLLTKSTSLPSSVDTFLRARRGQVWHTEVPGRDRRRERRGAHGDPERALALGGATSSGNEKAPGRSPLGPAGRSVDDST